MPNYQPTSLGYSLLAHDNDYGFDPCLTSIQPVEAVPDLSILIPYYDTSLPVIASVLSHLSRAIGVVRREHPSWDYEILLLDDGSQRFPLYDLPAHGDLELVLIRTELNQGRTRTRNHALGLASHTNCLFLDSDVSLSPDCLLAHLRLHGTASLAGGPSIITTSFFKPARVLSQHPDIATPVDFRIWCKYQASWIGGEQDVAFIGSTFRTLDQTHQWRNWDRMLGPWCLANMVLGGAFMVNRRDALRAQGFDSMFASYGFEETSLPTKLIAGFGCRVVPQTRTLAVHYEANPAHLSQEERDLHFRAAHRKYYDEYLRLTVDDALRRPSEGWPPI